MLVLDTIAPSTLAAEFTANSSRAWTVEATIKSTSGFPVETLRDLYRFATDNDKVRFVVTKAAALKAEREAAHAEALEVNEARCICSMVTGTRCWDHRRMDALRATTANGALRALHRAHND